MNLYMYSQEEPTCVLSVGFQIGKYIGMRTSALLLVFFFLSTIMAGDGVEASDEFEHFYAAYERAVESEIKGEMQESCSIIRDNGDGTYEMQVYYIVSESAASKARIRALENMAKESAAAQQYAEKVSEFVKEGFSE